MRNKNIIFYMLPLIFSVFIYCDSLDLYQYALDNSLGPRFLSFTVNNIKGKINLSDKTVDVNILAGSAVTGLIPEFTFYGVQVAYAGTPVSSGSLTLDFTTTHDFTITDEHGLSSTFTVTVRAEYYPTLDVYCVSQTTGDDNNAGTKELPLATVSKAIDRAAPSRSDVLVAADGNTTYTETIILHDGVSLSGHWDTTFSSQSQVTILKGTDPTGTIQGDGAIGTATVISDFNVIGADVDGSTSISLINGASPTLQKLTVEPGTSSTTTCGIYLQNSNAVIRSNTSIAGGYGTLGSTAILVVTGSPIIDGNKQIFGGNSSNGSIGISALNSVNLRIANNVVSGGAAASEDCISIMLIGNSQAYIVNNTINAGSIATTGMHLGILLEESGTNSPHPYIINNIFCHGVDGEDFYAIYENSENADPAEVSYNHFYIPTAGTDWCYNDFLGAGDINTAAGLEALSDMAVVFGSNTIGDPGFVNLAGNNYHLDGTNDDVTIYGIYTGYTYDQEGTERTDPWSKGAYEYVP